MVYMVYTTYKHGELGEVYYCIFVPTLLGWLAINNRELMGKDGLMEVVFLIWRRFNGDFRFGWWLARRFNIIHRRFVGFNHQTYGHTIDKWWFVMIINYFGGDFAQYIGIMIRVWKFLSTKHWFIWFGWWFVCGLY